MYDLIIKNGKIVDGTASPAYHSDIAIVKGKIAKIERNIKAEAKKIIDAKGLTVTPGFIDSHSHSDDAIFNYSDMIEKIEQGITTSVAGQCGSSFAPIVKENDKYETFGKLSEKAKKVSLGSNILSFVGHGSLRIAVIGYENVKATVKQLEEMGTLLRDAMENGAVGLSFGLIYTPSCYADTDEMIYLAKIVKEYEGIVSAHIRSEGFEFALAVEEFLNVIKATDVKGVLSHHKAMYKENWGKVNHTLKMIDEAVKEGYDVYCDLYPYEASSTFLSATVIPKEFRDVDGDGLVKLLSDKNKREEIKKAYSSKFGDSLDNLQIATCSTHPEYEGLRVSEIARMLNKDQFDTAFDIISETHGNAMICNFCMCEEDIEAVLKFERSMICTDSSVAKGDKTFHPRLKGTFPRVIGRYGRDRKVISLQEAIRKCTSMPASVYGLKKKGLICEGFDADICIFDADKILDMSNYTNCNERCLGLNFVILNGEIVVENAIYNGNKKGKFIAIER